MVPIPRRISELRGCWWAARKRQTPHLGWQRRTPRASGCCEAGGDRPAVCGVPTLGLWPGSPRCAPSAASPAYPVLSPPAGGRAQEGRSFPSPPCLEPSGPGQVPKHLRRLRARLKPLFFWLVMAEEAAQGYARGLPPSLPAPRLSVHTSGRAVLISPNLLIPALEFTNICESREHSRRVETAPPSRWGSRCPTG